MFHQQAPCFHVSCPRPHPIYLNLANMFSPTSTQANLYEQSRQSNLQMLRSRSLFRPVKRQSHCPIFSYTVCISLQICYPFVSIGEHATHGSSRISFSNNLRGVMSTHTSHTPTSLLQSRVVSLVNYALQWVCFVVLGGPRYSSMVLEVMPTSRISRPKSMAPSYPENSMAYMVFTLRYLFICRLRLLFFSSSFRRWFFPVHFLFKP